MGRQFEKSITYILLLKFDIFDADQRRKLYERINGHIPVFGDRDVYNKLSGVRFILQNIIEFKAAFPDFYVKKVRL